MVRIVVEFNGCPNTRPISFIFSRHLGLQAAQPGAMNHTLPQNLSTKPRNTAKRVSESRVAVHVELEGAFGGDQSGD